MPNGSTCPRSAGKNSDESVRPSAAVARVAGRSSMGLPVGLDGSQRWEFPAIDVQDEVLRFPVISHQPLFGNYTASLRLVQAAPGTDHVAFGLQFNLLFAAPGDANLDWVVDQRDIVTVMQSGKYGTDWHASCARGTGTGTVCSSRWTSWRRCRRACTCGRHPTGT